MKNSIFIIYPYLDRGSWVFDDDSVGLVREPFVAGSDIFLSLLSEGKTELSVRFSDKWFPSAKISIEKIKKDEVFSGAWYYSKDFDMELWLCDATLLYFNPHPDKLFIELIK